MDYEEARNDPESPSDNIEESKEKLVAPISEKYRIPKESIRTEKVTNTSIFLSIRTIRTKVILVESKMRNDFSLLSVGTRASVTPERRIPRKKVI